ncbi:MAG: FkbM family methyltransferase [Planctomycetota bacterium]
MSSTQERRATYKFRSFCWKFVRKINKTATIRTKQGLLTVDTADRYIAKSLYCHREYEQDLMSRVAEHLRAVKLAPAKGTGTFVDIGANMGVTTVGMLYNKEYERAVAVEPDPRNFKLLERNVTQNGFGNRVICIESALSDRAGKIEFELSDTNFGDHRIRAAGTARANGEIYQESKRRVIEVATRPLDELWASLPAEFTKSLAVIWMDVQGFEASVIRGGMQLFRTPVALSTEIWPYGIQRSGISAFDFCELIKSIWPYYWMLRGERRNKRFVRYPTSIFETVFDELGFDGAYNNVLLTHR